MAAIPHILTLILRACKAGLRLEIRIPVTLIYVSKEVNGALLFTNEKGLIECREGPKILNRFLKAIAKKKKDVSIPVAVHHTSVGASTFCFSRKEAKEKVRNCPSSFHYIQQFIDNKTHSPELLCAIWSPSKPPRFFFVVKRRTPGKQMSPELFSGVFGHKESANRMSESFDSWTVNRSDHRNCEILESVQADPSVSSQSEQVWGLLTYFGIKNITEVITDFLLGRDGNWVFKSITHVEVGDIQGKASKRPGTASIDSLAKISLQNKVPFSPPKQTMNFSNSQLLSASLVLKPKKEEKKSPEKAMGIRNLQDRVMGLRTAKPPQVRIDSIPGRRPRGPFSDVPDLNQLNIINPVMPTSPKCSHTLSNYEQLMTNELDNITNSYDSMQRAIKEFHDRRDFPKRCIYYYPDSFWHDVVMFLATKLQEDLKTFPMFYRMESKKLIDFLTRFVIGLRHESLPTPLSHDLLEACVELSLPRLDISSFTTLLRAAFQVSRVREEELEIVMRVYKDNIQVLLNYNWKKNLTSFLTKKIMTSELMEKMFSPSYREDSNV